ncbi:hypothetical protein [Streptococcus parasuis]|uniref:hypothetical protein n=1 Tax=Streptococcus parasuis TaxID=1501662 RepID=UPI0028A0F895|nr:hypothetical protein [Streptococcus parasuis]
MKKHYYQNNQTYFYNYLKNKKHAYRQEKAEIQRKIVEIYHRENGVPGYRMMNDYLKGIGSIRSDLTIHHLKSLLISVRLIRQL